MVVVVDDDRTYAESLCEELVKLLGNRAAYRGFEFDWNTRTEGPIRCFNEFREAEEGIEELLADLETVGFLVLDVMLPIPEGVPGDAMSGGAILFNELGKRRDVSRLVRRTAFVTHFGGFEVGKLDAATGPGLRDLLSSRVVLKMEVPAQAAAKLIADWMSETWLPDLIRLDLMGGLSSLQRWAHHRIESDADGLANRATLRPIVTDLIHGHLAVVNWLNGRYAPPPSACCYSLPSLLSGVEVLLENEWSSCALPPAVTVKCIPSPNGLFEVLKVPPSLMSFFVVKAAHFLAQAIVAGNSGRIRIRCEAEAGNAASVTVTETSRQVAPEPDLKSYLKSRSSRAVPGAKIDLLDSLSDLLRECAGASIRYLLENGHVSIRLEHVETVPEAEGSGGDPAPVTRDGTSPENPADGTRGPPGKAVSPFERLAAIGLKTPEVSSDVERFLHHAESDPQSALNKARVIAEGVLLRLARRHDVEWGEGKATLDRLVGPVTFCKVLPRPQAEHVRTIQNYTSPNSHYQDIPPGGAQVTIVAFALAELLGWFYS